MEKILRHNNLCSLRCDNDHVLHDMRETNISEIRQITIKSSDIEYWEELPNSELSPYSEEDYKAKVAELIHERYDDDEEKAMVNNFLDENPTEEHLAEYRAYQAFRAKCKQRAKDPQLYRKETDEI